MKTKQQFIDEVTAICGKFYDIRVAQGDNGTLADAGRQCGIILRSSPVGWLNLIGEFPNKIGASRVSEKAKEGFRQRNEIVKCLYLEKGMNASQIGIKLGLSRERVRQILANMGVDVIAAYNKKWNASLLNVRPKKTARIKRMIKLASVKKKYTNMRKAWDNGMLMGDMAVKFKFANAKSLSNVIYRLRNAYGWFPLRRIVNELGVCVS